MQDQDLEIVPAVRIGPYHLKWDLETLKKNLPANYIVTEDAYTWYVEFEDYLIGIRKADNQIDFITVRGKFRQHFKNKITCESTHGQIEDDFGPTAGYSFDDLPAYPGMEMYFEDEEEGDEDENSWKKIKIIRIAVVDPLFIWDEHFSLEDYDRMEQTKYECPFPKDKFIENPYKKK